MSVKPTLKEACKDILRVPWINRATRRIVRPFVPPHLRAKFDWKMPVAGEFPVALPNGQVLHWLPRRDSHLARYLARDGWDGYETCTARLFYHLAQHAPVTFDVGAYLGYFAFLGAAAAPGNRAYAFEALPALAKSIRKIAARNPGLAVEVVAAAVCDRVGTVEFFVESPWLTNSSANPAFLPAGYGGRRRRVRCAATDLDTFIARHGVTRLDLMKIDTETTEPDVLKGMPTALRAFHPVIIMEVLPCARLDEIGNFMQSYGYRCAWITDEKLVGKDRPVPDESLRFMNYLFWPRELAGPRWDVVRARLI